VYFHLHGAGASPIEYVELILCRDVYHCLPSELAEEDLITVLNHLACLEGEAQYRKKQRDKADRKYGTIGT
jgi:hypothetical protein